MVSANVVATVFFGFAVALVGLIFAKEGEKEKHAHGRSNRYPPQTPELSVKCAVCFELLENLSVLPCGHIFCEDCAQKVAMKFKVCPKCKHPCTVKHVKRVYL